MALASHVTSTHGNYNTLCRILMLHHHTMVMLIVLTVSTMLTSMTSMTTMSTMTTMTMIHVTQTSLS